ncbi:MAG: C4-dicarboxylate transporter [Alphaproteobacteria bacterium]|jgi:TRAP transporter TAXI family solute receptor|nr:C4-dicarboxylate transporter [Alphaproteobacteria bacterium]
MQSRYLTIAGAALLAATVALPAGAQVKLPEQMSWTAYDTGSSGFNMAVAIGQVFKTKYNSDIRVLPAGNDVARLQPLKTGRATASAMGIGTYFAQEGVMEFGVKEWGPQPLQLILSSTACNGLSLGVAKDSGIKDVKDMKGKRIGFVVGSPALNQNALAIMAFGGVTRNDVKIVEFSNYGAMWKGMVNNEVDAAFASTISGQAKEVEASPRGLVWPAMPASDKAGWDRVAKVGPYFYPHKATCGAGGITKDAGIDMAAYPYPIVMVYESQPADLVYSIAKAMIETYPQYRDAAPGADGFEVKRQNLTWVIPYHAGTIKALKEAGAWTDAAQKHNDALLKRQATLATAWKAYVATNPADDKFAAGWSKARADALKKVGMDPVFE